MNSDNDTSRDDNTSIFLPVTVEQIHHDTALIGQDSGNPSVFEPSVIAFLYENARQLVELVLKGGHKARERKHLEELLDKMSCGEGFSQANMLYLQALCQSVSCAGSKSGLREALVGHITSENCHLGKRVFGVKQPHDDEDMESDALVDKLLETFLDLASRGPQVLEALEEYAEGKNWKKDSTTLSVIDTEEPYQHPDETEIQYTILASSDESIYLIIDESDANTPVLHIAILRDDGNMEICDAVVYEAPEEDGHEYYTCRYGSTERSFFRKKEDEDLIEFSNDGRFLFLNGQTPSFEFLHVTEGVDEPNVKRDFDVVRKARLYENLDAYILKEKEKDDHFVVFHTHPSRVDIQAVDEIAFLDDAAFQVSRYGIHYLIPTGVNAAHQVISAASEIIPDVVTVCGKRVLSTQDGTWISPDDSKPVQGIESCTLLSPEIIDPGKDQNGLLRVEVKDEKTTKVQFLDVETGEFYMKRALPPGTVTRSVNSQTIAVRPVSEESDEHGHYVYHLKSGSAFFAQPVMMTTLDLPVPTTDSNMCPPQTLPVTFLYQIRSGVCGMYTLGHDGEIVSLRKQLDWNISWWVSDPKKLKITCQDDGSVQFGGVTRKTCIRSLCLGKKDVPDFPAGDILMLAYGDEELQEESTS